MGFQRNTIPDEEYKQRLSNLMPRLSTRTHSKEDIIEMFFLYNDRLTPRETGINCGGCRNRVFKRIQQYYNEIK